MAFALLCYSVLVTVKVPESHSMYHILSSYIVDGFPRQTHRLMVLSRVSGLAGPLMYLFPNCTALPRGQPADERLGGTIDITAVCSEARLNPAANVRYKRRGKWWGNIETAKQSLWTFGPEQFFSFFFFQSSLLAILLFRVKRPTCVLCFHYRPLLVWRMY